MDEGYQTLEAEIVGKYKEYIRDYDFSGLTVPNVRVMNWIQKGLMDENLERALLNSKGVQDEIAAILDRNLKTFIGDATGLNRIPGDKGPNSRYQQELNGLLFLADVVIKMFMNCNQSTLIALIGDSAAASQAAASTGETSPYNVFFTKYAFRLLPSVGDVAATQARNEYLAQRDEMNSTVKYVTIVPGKNPYVKSITYWGGNYVNIDVKPEAESTGTGIVPWDQWTPGYQDVLPPRDEDSDVEEEKVDEDALKTEEAPAAGFSAAAPPADQ